MKWIVFAFLGLVCLVGSADAASLSSTIMTSKSDNSARAGLLQPSEGEQQNMAAISTAFAQVSRRQIDNGSNLQLKNIFQFAQPQKTTSFSANSSQPTPEPATLFLFGSGLAGCIFVFRKRLLYSE